MMRNHALPYFFIGLIFAVLFVSGCTTKTETTTATTTELGVKQFNMIIGHTFYNPSTLIVKQGDTIRIRAIADSGTGSHMHGITIDDYGINEVVTTEDPNNPVVIEFVANQVGQFKIYCQSCFTGPFGARHPNIQGTLVVQK